MTWIQQMLVVIVLMTTLCAVSYMAGSSAVQKEWGEEKARIAAIASHEKAENARNLTELRTKWEKEKRYAESEAGKRAVAEYIRSRVLPHSSEVRDANHCAEAIIPKRIDAASGESGLAGGLQEFAERCAEDASRVDYCTQWAIRENLPVE